MNKPALPFFLLALVVLLALACSRTGSEKGGPNSPTADTALQRQDGGPNTRAIISAADVDSFKTLYEGYIDVLIYYLKNPQNPTARQEFYTYQEKVTRKERLLKQQLAQDSSSTDTTYLKRIIAFNREMQARLAQKIEQTADTVLQKAVQEQYQSFDSIPHFKN